MVEFFFSKSKQNARVDRVVKFHCECLLFFVKGSRARLVIFKPEHKLFKFGINFVMCVNLLHL